MGAIMENDEVQLRDAAHNELQDGACGLPCEPFNRFNFPGVEGRPLPAAFFLFMRRLLLSHCV